MCKPWSQAWTRRAPSHIYTAAEENYAYPEENCHPMAIISSTEKELKKKMMLLIPALFADLITYSAPGKIWSTFLAKPASASHKGKSLAKKVQVPWGIMIETESDWIVRWSLWYVQSYLMKWQPLFCKRTNGFDKNHGFYSRGSSSPSNESVIHSPGLSYSQNAFVRSCIGPNA